MIVVTSRIRVTAGDADALAAQVRRMERGVDVYEVLA